MPSSLPDPVLALSMDNVHKLNDLNLDQLANLWNVFTKCKESLESGRRLENLSWRLWFREAHLLPPDVALSDLADFTPLDTPLLSRANSVAGSYQHSRLSALLGQASAALSDPEPEPDSSSALDSDAEAAATTAASSRHQAKRATTRRTPPAARLSPRKEKSQPEAGPSSRHRRVQLSWSRGSSSGSKQASGRKELAEASASPSQSHHLQQPPQPVDQATDRDSLWDRKRAVSSSSAFGSRARVKQRNQSVSRRRPLSFQMAIESLYLDASSKEGLNALVPTRPGLSRMSSEMLSSTGAIDAPPRPSLGNAFKAAERFSAPAEYSSTIASSAHSPQQVLQQTQQQKDRASPSAAVQPAATSISPSPSAGQDVEPCHAPETVGPISPSKMNVTIVPTIGAISRQPSPSHLPFKVTAAAETSREQEEKEAARLMPPPPAFVRLQRAASPVADTVTNGNARQSSASTREPAPSTKDAPEQVLNEAAAVAAAAAAAAATTTTTTTTTTGASSAFYLASPESTCSVASSRGPSEASTVGPKPAPAAKPSAAHKSNKASLLHAGHRTKSSSGLQRDHRHHKSHDRLPVKRNSQVRLGNVLSGLTMTKAVPTAPAAPGPQQKGKRAAAATAQNANKKPVQFTMGCDDDSDSFEDDEDFEDEDDAAVAQQQAKQAAAASSAPALAAQPAPAKKAEVAAVAAAGAADDGDDDGFEDEEDDEEWASDPEAEEAERQAQAAALAQRRGREEEEHQKAMFKKIPIRSKSAADVRLLSPQQTSAGPSPPQQPVRSLLTSMFHPDEQHSPPGQLAGRPHASAADLRAKPSLSSGLALIQKVKITAASRKQSRSSTRDSGPSPALGPVHGLSSGLRTSKSAVALPLLDTSVMRSSTGGGKARQQQQQQRQGEVSGRRQSEPHNAAAAAAASVEDGASSSSHGSTGGKPSSVAMAKLNALAHMRSHADRHRGGHLEADATAREAESRAIRLEVSPGNDDDVAHSPSLLDSRLQQQRHPHLGMDTRSKSEMSTAEPMAAPSLARHRSSLDLPETAAPQTPRTMRRNMLRDELSESLRQNLLWERQSRTRMLGIGTKKETVLGGNQLRPLTSAHPTAPASSSQQQQSQSQQSLKPKRYSEEWGSFHHKGW